MVQPMAHRREIRPLTGVRGVAAILVALYHFAHAMEVKPGGALFGVPNGYLSVDLFFMLSGFVLAYTYSEKFQTGFDLQDYREFFIKRVARIYPPYFLIMLLHLFVMMFSRAEVSPLHQFGWLDYVANLFMLTVVGLDIYRFIGPSWSVSAEMFCYILFPFVILLAFHSVTRIAALVSIAVIGLFIIAITQPGVNGALDIVATESFAPLGRAMCGFFLGVGYYWVYNRLALGQRAFPSWVSALVIAALLAIWFSSDNEAVRYFCLFVLLAVLSMDDTVSNSLFANPIVYYLGKISYSIYLVHGLALVVSLRAIRLAAEQMSYPTAFWLVTILYVGLVITISHLSYLYFEVKGRDFFLSLSKGYLSPKRA